MPYPGIPSHLTGKMEDCVRKVKAKGGKVNAYAVCHASIMGKHKQKDKEYNRKALGRIGRK